MNKFKTCKHIKSSLYLAPDEIRACCQRFFYDGKMRGDAKLIKKENFKDLNEKTLVSARMKMLKDIQEDKNDDCLGCKYLETSDDKPIADNSIELLSVEQHSFCNLRCNYCSEIYYGGSKPKYDVLKFINDLTTAGSFEKCRQVVWGGGEPTLDKSFENIFETIQAKASPKIYHRVFTNSVRYSKALEKFLLKGLVKITTSLDSGTKKTFQKVRGRNKFNEVLLNLKKYSEIDPTKVTIKYILTEENKEQYELKYFVENILKYNLSKCYFQISVDYKKETIDLSFVKSIVYLMDLLNKKNIKKYFVDDHVLARILKLDKDSKKEINNFAIKYNLNSIIVPDKEKALNIYGAGQICHDLFQNTNIQNNFKSFKIYDSNAEKFGKKINGIEISSPLNLKNNFDKIYITSAHSYDDILSNIIKIQKSDKNVINGLFI